MLNYKDIFLKNSFSMSKTIKKKWYFINQKKLCNFHYKYSKDYKKITNNFFGGIKKKNNIEELPYLHSSIFKNQRLISKIDSNSEKIFRSSGTTGKKYSQISIDKKTSFLQARTLNKIFNDFFNEKFDHIFFIDNNKIQFGSESFTARGSAIKGFSQLAKNKTFLLNENFEINLKSLKNYIKRNPNKKFIIFGFTSFIHEFFIKKLKTKKIKLNLKNSILIHGGGWKKMEDKRISRYEFNKMIRKVSGISKVYNYYGMVEQTGSVFFECEKGFFHSSIFSEVLIRDKNLKSNVYINKGLVQVMSLLPLSYPGHNILTEDLGKIYGEDTCKCGRKGTYFKILGRVPNTELRGCSDTY